jgi:hypothetical protein
VIQSDVVDRAVSAFEPTQKEVVDDSREARAEPPEFAAIGGTAIR